MNLGNLSNINGDGNGWARGWGLIQEHRVLGPLFTPHNQDEEGEEQEKKAESDTTHSYILKVGRK